MPIRFGWVRACFVCLSQLLSTHHAFYYIHPHLTEERARCTLLLCFYLPLSVFLSECWHYYCALWLSVLLIGNSPFIFIYNKNRSLSKLGFFAHADFQISWHHPMLLIFPVWIYLALRICFSNKQFVIIGWCKAQRALPALNHCWKNKIFRNWKNAKKSKSSNPKSVLTKIEQNFSWIAFKTVKSQFSRTH